MDRDPGIDSWCPWDGLTVPLGHHDAQFGNRWSRVYAKTRKKRIGCTAYAHVFSPIHHWFFTWYGLSDSLNTYGEKYWPVTRCRHEKTRKIEMCDLRFGTFFFHGKFGNGVIYRSALRITFFYCANPSEKKLTTTIITDYFIIIILIWSSL